MANEPSTRRDIEDILGALNALNKQTDDHSCSIDTKLSQADKRLEIVEYDTKSIKTSIERIQNTIDNYIIKMDKLEAKKEDKSR